MIQINLIPDIKQEMLRAQRMRNVTITFSIFAGIIAAGIVATLGLILGTQAVAEALTDKGIKDEYSKLSGTKDINNSLTIKNQLGTISALNDNRTIDSRLLDVVAAINPAAPNDVKISKVTLDPSQTQLTLEGSAAGGYTATDVFRKTILNTIVNAKNNGESVELPLTEDVTLQNTSYGQDASGAKVVRFTIIFTYPKGLFDNTMSDVIISTPTAKIDVTDSKTRVPDSMFTQPATAVEEDK